MKAKINAKERLRRERENLRPVKLLAQTTGKCGPRNKYYNIRKCRVRTGEVIEAYPSISEAAEANNISAQNIYQCLRGHRYHHTAGGYKWFGDKKEVSQ
jgi:hypothetical protein